MRIPLPLRVVENSWAYYLLKHGLIRKACLRFRTKPDRLLLEFDQDGLRRQWDPVKQLLKLIVAGEFEFHARKNEMLIYSAKGAQRRETFDLLSIASLRYAMDHQVPLEYAVDPEFFIVTAGRGRYRFLVPKCNPSALPVLKSVCDEDEYGFLYPYLPGKVVVDVGANIGDTAVVFSGEGAASVEAYEIHPALHAIAQKNIELNHMGGKVRLYGSGIGSADGEMVMRDDSALGPTAGFGLKESRHGREITVNLVAMKSVIDRLGRIDVLKMDCEGAEYGIFDSLGDEDLKKIAVIGLEYHRDPQPLVARFEGAGFNVSLIAKYGPELGLMLATRS